LQNCERKEKRGGGGTEHTERQLTFPPLPPAPAVRRCTSTSTSCSTRRPELARRSAVGGRLASGSGGGGGSDQIALFCFGCCSSAVPVSCEQVAAAAAAELRCGARKGRSGIGLSLKAAAVGWGWELWWGMHGHGELMGSWLMPMAMGVVL